MTRSFRIVDLFAGPGGLSEGFWSYRTPHGHRPYAMGLSVEKERAAHSTLLLRNFLRLFGDEPPAEYRRCFEGGPEPDWESLRPAEWRRAKEETLLHELQRGVSDEMLDPLLDRLREETHGNTILLGGPPCQAYSIVGRARNAGKASYRPEEDERHFLYEEYLRILRRLRPAAFVMENVRGFLSSQVAGCRIFERVLEDLSGLLKGDDGYVLLPFLGNGKESSLPLGFPRPEDFLLRAEAFGIPQARHRVFIIGIRKDCLKSGVSGIRLESRAVAPAGCVLEGLPPLRSGLRGHDSGSEWKKTMIDILRFLQLAPPELEKPALQEYMRLIADTRQKIERMDPLPRRSRDPAGVGQGCPARLAEWILGNAASGTANHETRAHMASDLARYMFAALFGLATGRSPKARDFPQELAPRHRNWNSGKFADRFRVQLPDRPSTTITAHISKDGHYFIHPDPLQCRSLTVREAARLQTFPDNYLFRGNRTQQYVQVGNAVPPLLANLLAEAIYELIEER